MNHHGEIGPFFKKTVCIVERATYPCVSPVGRFKEEGETDVSVFFLCSGERKKRGLPLAAKLHRHLGIGDRPLMMPDRP